MDMADQSTQPDRRGLIGWIIAHPKSALTLAILLMVALAILGFSRAAESRLAAKIAAIKAKGEPTTIQDLLARQRPVPDMENRTVAVGRIGSQLQLTKLSEEQSVDLHYLGHARQKPTGIRWTQKEIESAQDYLKRVDTELADLHKAMGLHDAAYAIKWTTPALVTQMPELSWMRGAASALTLEAMTAAMAGDPARAERLLLDAQGLSQLTEGGDTIMSALVQIGIDSLFSDLTERVINQGALSDVALREIDQSLCAREGSVDLKRAYMAERVTFLDTMIWMRTNKGNVTPLYGASANGQANPLSYWAYVPALPALDMAEGLKFYDVMITGLRGPTGESVRKSMALDAGLSSMPWYSIISNSMVVRLSRPVVLWVRGIGQMRALRVALAAERYRLANGHWPADANALTPRFLNAIPPDPIDGNPIRYAIIPEGIKTWTISGDGADEDNGGDIRRLEPTNAAQRMRKDNGWLLLNPDLRGRASNSPDVTAPSKTAPSTHPNTGK